ncbi:hypothetical protein Mgra_00010278 [Meloidogyne graminicola]|uniref:G_PROTEIN_RECEP_F1_2 domain-containing protein n=1 Tax=Meloidogyne graminicola TaxID=189291 RepID=A0A8S9Z5M7_9BILA|nr:hypothetical protein Mgra_00010278 [Meloidogyne graminicola]
MNVYSKNPKYSVCSLNLWNMPRSESQQLNIKQRQQRRSYFKLTISVALILLLYTISWALPTAIWFAFNLLNYADRTRINYVTFVQGFLTPFGSGINLYIYLWKHAEIRNSAVSTLPWLKNILYDEIIINPIPTNILRSGLSKQKQTRNIRNFEMSIIKLKINKEIILNYLIIQYFIDSLNIFKRFLFISSKSKLPNSKKHQQPLLILNNSSSSQLITKK